MSQLADDCKRYIQELNQPYDVVSRSHETLRELYYKHGRDAVDQWLANYWQAPQYVYTYTADTTRPCCPSCAGAVELPSGVNPALPWQGKCNTVFCQKTHTYQLEDEDDDESTT